MGPGEYLVGTVAFAGTAAAAAAAAAIVLGRGFSHLAGAVRAVAFGVLATLALTWAHLLPGMLGILDRWTALAAAVLLAVAASLTLPVTERPRLRTGSRGEPPPSSLAAAALAAAAVVAVAVAAAAYLRATGAVPTMGIDALSFHLPGVGEWIRSGSLWEVSSFVPNQAHGYYPGNGDVILLAGSLPWEDDAFLRFVGLPFLALAGLAIYAAALELGAARATAATAAALFAAIPVVMLPPLQDVMPDAVMLSTFGAGCLFLLRGARTGGASEFTLAGLALGLAFGTKWYGVTSVAVVVAVWALSSARAGRAPAWVARRLALLAAMIAAAGGFWFLRNLVASGNPVFPVHVQVLGLTVFDAPPDPLRESLGFTIADYVGDGDAWSDYLWPALWRTLKAPAVLLAAGVLASLWVGLRGRAGADRRLVGVAAATLLLAVAYALTPYSALGPEGSPTQADANTRYLLPALLLAAPAAAAASTALAVRSPGAGLAIQAVALGALAVGLAGGLAAGLGPVVEATSAIVAAAVAAAWVHRQVGAGRLPAAAAVAGAVLLLAAALAGGYGLQKRFNRAPYLGADPALDVLLREAPEGRRIAVAGQWTTAPPAPVFPSFGSRFGNEVSYAGPEVEHMLRRYRNCSDLLGRLRADRDELLLVGRPAPDRPAPEERCARRARVPELAGSDRFALFALGSEQGPARDDAAAD